MAVLLWIIFFLPNILFHARRQEGTQSRNILCGLALALFTCNDLWHKISKLHSEEYGAACISNTVHASGEIRLSELGKIILKLRYSEVSNKHLTGNRIMKLKSPTA